MFGFFEKAAELVLPGWAKYAAIAVAGVAIYFLGQLHGERVAGQAHIDYVLAQATQSIKIVQGQVKVVTAVQTVVQEKIKKIYLQGEKIETIVHDLVVPGDDDRFRVNVGFVRAYNAAWSGVPPGPANDLDREPAAVPLSAVASTEASNATSARVWRVQALCWRAFYAGQQQAINRERPAWFKPADEDEKCVLP